MTSDVLSEILSAIRLSGSVFFDVSAAAPWVAEAPASARIANYILPGALYAIEYHAVMQGSCWISIVDGPPFDPVRLDAGDIAVIPRGEPHVVSSSPHMRAEPHLESHRRPPNDNELPFKLRAGSDGTPDARIICGFFTCDVQIFVPLLDALPRFMRIGRGMSEATDALLQHFLAGLLEHTASRSGAQGVLNKLSELLFIEAIRTQMERLDTSDAGWLSGLRDPLVGRSLSILHGRPAHAWTLEALASECGASRSTLANRFTELMGMPPIQYLTRWRMQLAARRLKDGTDKVSSIAQQVGYDSEAAFSRAFKKYAGRSPTDYR
jgi:AraC-like DNA-binding protein